MSGFTTFPVGNFRGDYDSISTHANLREEIKTSLNWQYGESLYETVGDRGPSVDLYSRVVVPILASMYSGVVQTVFHVAMAGFHACQGDFTRAQVNIYACTRDLEESLGWLITIFHEATGSYLVQDALFQKSCYSLFESRHTPRVYNREGPASEYYGISIPDDVARISLEEYKDMSKIERDRITEALENHKDERFTTFRLGTSIGFLGKDFFKKLSETPDEILAQLTVADLILNNHTKKVTYALLPNEQFKAIKLEDLDTIDFSDLEEAYRDKASIELILYIGKRLEFFKEDLKEIQSIGKIKDLTIVKFYNADMNIINKSLEKESNEQQKARLKASFRIDTIEQCTAYLLKLQQDQSKLVDNKTVLQGKLSSSVSQLQVSSKKNLASQLTDNVKSLEQSIAKVGGMLEDINHRLDLLENLKSLLAQNPLDPSEIIPRKALPLLRKEQIQNMNPSICPAAVFAFLFGNRLPLEEERLRFSWFLPETVQWMLLELREYSSLVSDQQLAQLDLKKFPRDYIKHLFGNTPKKAEARMACLKPDQQKMIAPYLLYYDLVSNPRKWIRLLDFQGLNRHKTQSVFGHRNDVAVARMRYLSSEQIQSALKQLGRCLFLIPKERLHELDLTGLTHEELRNLLGEGDDERARERFSCLSKSQIQLILPKLEEFSWWIPTSQVSGFDISELSLRNITQLCGDHGFETLDVSVPQAKNGLSNTLSFKSERRRLLSSSSGGISEPKLFENYGKEVKVRFQSFSSDQVLGLLSKVGSENEIPKSLNWISKDQMSGLDFGKLEKNNLCFFLGILFNEKESAKERIQWLLSSQIQPVLLAFASENLLQHFSKEQINGLDLTPLSDRNLIDLLGGPEIAKTRVPCIQSINPILDRLHPFYIRLLSDAQVRSIDVEFPEEKKSKIVKKLFPSPEKSAAGLRVVKSIPDYAIGEILAEDINGRIDKELEKTFFQNTRKMRLLGADKMNHIKHLLDQNNQQLLHSLFNDEESFASV